jgi:hypothetical protein
MTFILWPVCDARKKKPAKQRDAFPVSVAL